MSDSEVDVPSAASVSKAIRDVVISIHKAGNDDDLTVNHVRTAAEQKLGIPAGFLKNGDWKNESKTLIKEAVDQYCGDESPAEPSLQKPSKTKAKAKPEPEKKSTKPTADSGLRGTKRKATAPAKKLQKRRKTSSSNEESSAALSDSHGDDDEPSDAESEPVKKHAGRQKKVVEEDSEEDVRDEKTQAASAKDSERLATPPAPSRGDDGDSDLSSVLDESPPKKRKQKAEKPAKTVKSTKAKPKTPKAEDDPDQVEIKRLQGWLVKCGIRKVWGKELAKCDTSKDKIRHLKGMLKDAGMDGKYSVEKAARIKEQREFAKDLEEIQAGAAAWGETTSTGRPRRAAARSVQQVTLVQDSEDEDEEDKNGEAKNQATDDDDDEDEESHSASASDDSAGEKDDEDDDEDSD